MLPVGELRRDVFEARSVRSSNAHLGFGLGPPASARTSRAWNARCVRAAATLPDMEYADASGA
jgi:hypothetical protein